MISKAIMLYTVLPSAISLLILPEAVANYVVVYIVVASSGASLLKKKGL